MSRRLSVPQMNRLDKIADENPDAKVVDWLGTEPGGPVVEIEPGRYRYINNHGRLVATMRPRTASGTNYGGHAA